MKEVMNLQGEIIEVPFNTPCHPGKNGELPKPYDPIIDADIFTEMEERKVIGEAEQENYIANHKYKDDRRAMQKSFGDQLDMIYWDKKNGTNLWEQEQDIIKLTIPKPGV